MLIIAIFAFIAFLFIILGWWIYTLVKHTKMLAETVSIYTKVISSLRERIVKQDEELRGIGNELDDANDANDAIGQLKCNLDDLRARCASVFQFPAN